MSNVLYTVQKCNKFKLNRNLLYILVNPDPELLYAQPNKVKKTSKQTTSEMPADEINYEPSADEVSDGEALPEVPPQSADILYSAVNKT